MPGISGIITYGTYKDKASILKQMVNCMTHEPIHALGTYINERFGLFIGWVEHRGSFSDCVPVWNETKDICLVFSGEDFSDQDEVDYLRKMGHEFNGKNASYLVHLYEEMGLKFFNKLNGWFCGLLVDSRIGNAFLFNDRYGMHRIFIHENKDGMYFSSEAKALLSVLPEVRKFDPKGLGEFLTCGCTLGNQTLYKDITVLPAGGLWIFKKGEVKKTGSYFDKASWVNQHHLDEKQFVYSFVESFGGIAKRYYRGTLPVGISLTGGLDSRMIMAGLDMKPEKIPCYTFGSMYRDTFDVQTAREVANVCGQPHHILVLGEEFIHNFQNYLEKAVYISDGYMGVQGAAELYVNSLARDIAPVRLTGNYGGELLRGHRAFKCAIPRGEFMTPGLIPHLHEAQSTFQELEATDPVTFALFKQAPSQGYGRRTIERSQVILRTPFMDNDLVNLVYQAPSHLLKGEALSAGIISRYNPDLLKIPTDRGFLSNSSFIRSLTRRLHRKALIKAEYWSSHGMPNWLAMISRYGIGRFIEKTFLGRDKFQHLRLWTQKYFATYITDVLLQGCDDLAEFLNTHQVERMVREHVAGRQNYTEEIDKILTLTLAYRIFLKNSYFETVDKESVTFLT